MQRNLNTIIEWLLHFKQERESSAADQQEATEMIDTNWDEKNDHIKLLSLSKFCLINYIKIIKGVCSTAEVYNMCDFGLWVAWVGGWCRGGLILELIFIMFVIGWSSISFFTAFSSIITALGICLTFFSVWSSPSTLLCTFRLFFAGLSEPFLPLQCLWCWVIIVGWRGDLIICDRIC